ncbi:universal stress protein [Albirhodobacter sp. R86504]|jgi:nucleotide-binding universal stress UspA family protein|uniref:universal stress protein n=1 Tax=Albirhodobacter sp. R86504 TaxID=3093848 RepID=UPI00366B1CE4
MNYKTVMTVLTRPAYIEADLAPAIAAAQDQDAHLDVLCLGLDLVQTGYYFSGASAALYQEGRALAEEDARKLQEAAKAALSEAEAQGVKLRWSTEQAVAQLGSVGALIGQRARFADLVVASSPYGEDCGSAEEAIVEAALFDARTSVLLAPKGQALTLAPRRVVVAWNQSNEALCAIRKALPVLKCAERVDITVIDPPSHGPERSDPGGQLAQWLARHGVNCEISVLAKTLPRAVDVLQRHLTDTKTDMLVMGAYGQSRLREAILGGTTRNMLESATTPVFMAH